jgi:hypothetical protein
MGAVPGSLTRIFRRSIMASKKKNPAESPAAKKSAKASKTTKTEAAPPAQAEGKRLSALDAAAKVLAEIGQPMNCTDLIAAMAAKGYWTSPGGKTPASTLYAALLRELKTKKDQARFRKTDRGKFGLA